MTQLEVVGEIENTKFFKVPQEETHESFVFQIDESVYQEKANAQQEFAGKEGCLKGFETQRQKKRNKGKAKQSTMRQAKADHDVIGCSGSRQPKNLTKTQIDAGDEDTKDAAQKREYVAEQTEATQDHDSFLLLANSKFDPPGEASINLPTPWRRQTFYHQEIRVEQREKEWVGS